MTLNLKHPFTIIVAGPCSCGNSTFVIRFLFCREQLCDIAFENIVWCHSENNAPHHLESVSFAKGVPEFVNPENIPSLIVLDYLMDSAYSAKVSQLFTKGSYHRNISLILITQNLFHQSPLSRGISLNLEQRYFRATLQKCLHLFEVMNRLQSQLHFLHVLKDAKPQARRALLASAGDGLIKEIVECAINTRNGNHKINK